MSVPKFTTPTFTLTFEDENLDLTDAVNVYVSFLSDGCLLTKSGEDLTVREKEIDVRLSQEETGRMKTGYIEIQANWTTPGGNRAASEVVTYPIGRQLLRRVIE